MHQKDLKYAPIKMLLIFLRNMQKCAFIQNICNICMTERFFFESCLLGSFLSYKINLFKTKMFQYSMIDKKQLLKQILNFPEYIDL